MPSRRVVRDLASKSKRELSRAVTISCPGCWCRGAPSKTSRTGAFVSAGHGLRQPGFAVDAPCGSRSPGQKPGQVVGGTCRCGGPRGRLDEQRPSPSSTIATRTRLRSVRRTRRLLGGRSPTSGPLGVRSGQSGRGPDEGPPAPFAGRSAHVSLSMLTEGPASPADVGTPPFSSRPCMVPSSPMAVAAGAGPRPPRQASRDGPRPRGSARAVRGGLSGRPGGPTASTCPPG